MTKDRTCTHPEEHHLHLCELKTRLSKSELDPLLKNPKYVCATCGGRVHQGRNLCAPIRIRR